MSTRHKQVTFTDTAGKLKQNTTCSFHLQEKWLWPWWLFPIFNRSKAPPGGYTKSSNHVLKQPTFFLSLGHPESIMLLLYFSREEKALTFAVRCRNALKLKEIEKDLDLRRCIKRWSDPYEHSEHHSLTYRAFYLSHDLQRPAVVHGDRLWATWEFAVFFRRSEQSGTKDGGYIVQRHLIAALVFSHPIRRM